MKTKGRKTKETGKLSLPGEPISAESLREEIRKAEDGPFFTVEESQKKLEKWRIKRNSR